MRKVSSDEIWDLEGNPVSTSEFLGSLDGLKLPLKMIRYQKPMWTYFHHVDTRLKEDTKGGYTYWRVQGYFEFDSLPIIGREFTCIPGPTLDCVKVTNKLEVWSTVLILR